MPSANPYDDLPDAIPGQTQGTIPQTTPQTTPSSSPLTQSLGPNPYDTLPDSPSASPYDSLPQSQQVAQTPQGQTPAPQPAEDSSQFMQGFKGAVWGQNIKLSGDALEGFGAMLDNGTVQQWGKDLSTYGAKEQAPYAAKVPSFVNIRTDSLGNFFGDTAKYLAYQSGSAIGSSVPMAATGTAALLVTKNPYIGLAMGAMGPSYIQNYGDVYGSARDDRDIQALIAEGKLTNKQVANTTALAAIPIAALDVTGLEGLLNKTLLKDIKRGFIKRVIHGIATGSIIEGTTEGLQEIFSQVTQSYLGSKTPLSEKVISVVDNTIGGMAGGGPMGGVGGAFNRGRPQVPGARQEDIGAAFDGLVPNTNNNTNPPPPPPGSPAAPILNVDVNPAAAQPTIYNEMNPPPQGLPITPSEVQPNAVTPAPTPTPTPSETPAPATSTQAVPGEVQPTPVPTVAQTPDVTLDIGFGYSVRSGNYGEGQKYALIDTEDNKVLATGKDFGEISQLANQFLEDGDIALGQVGLVRPDPTMLPQTPDTIAPADIKVPGAPPPPAPPEIYHSLTTRRVYTRDQAIGVAGQYLKNRNIPPEQIAREAEPFGGDVVQVAVQHGLRLRPGPKDVGPVATPPGQVPNRIVEFLHSKKIPITLPSERAPSPSNEPMKETVEVRPKSNIKRLSKMVGLALYGDLTVLPTTTVKEVFQNSFDAVKSMIDTGKIEKGKIDITADKQSRTYTIHDNGIGMSPETLQGPFLEIANSEKTEGVKSSGAFGIAKMLTLYGNAKIVVTSLKDGIVSRMATTGEALFDAMEEKTGDLPKLSYGAAISTDYEMFPDGHGTRLEITLPDKYENPLTGEVKDIPFKDSYISHWVLDYSPLFRNIDVTWNGRLLENTGSQFPAEDYTPVFTMKLTNGGSARVYASKAENTDDRSWRNKLHVLSNGIWQFSTNVPKRMMDPYGDKVPHTFYLDIDPNIKPPHVHYPFALNRGEFSPSMAPVFSRVAGALSRMYVYEENAADVKSYGDIHYLRGEPGAVIKTTPVSLEPTEVVETPLGMIRQGDEVIVQDGNLVVAGRVVPDLSPQELDKLTPDVGDLRVDQSTVDTTSTMIHDNVVVKLSDLEHKTITQLGQEKFGNIFDEYLFGLGEAFRELRTVVAGPEVLDDPGLLKSAIGLSFDISYRGVSITVPFEGEFINPALPEETDTLNAATGMIFTMIHELNHYRNRDHGVDWRAGFARTIRKLMLHRSFDFHGFIQKVVDHVESHRDVFDYINGFFTGTFDVEPRGRRFKDIGTDEAANARAVESVGQAGTPEPSAVPGRNRTGEGSARFTPKRTGSAERAGGTGIVEGYQQAKKLMEEIDRESSVPYPQPDLLPIKQAVNAAFTGPGNISQTPPANVQIMGVHADRMNKFYKYMYGSDRLADLNMRFTPLLRFNEVKREIRLDMARFQEAALRIVKRWRHLGKQTENLTAMIDDIANMNYRTPREVRQGIARWPTRQEFTALVNKHKVSKDSLDVFARVKKYFEIFLAEITKNAMDHARRVITDPQALADKLDAINTRYQQLSARPYFPFMRFGLHFVEVRNIHTNKVVYFETFERQGLKTAQRLQMSRKAQLEKQFPDRTRFAVNNGILPENVRPFLGLPPELLDSIQDQLQLTASQKDALDQLRYELSPAASFAHRFVHKSYTPGYSHDFIRAFSRYAFHGSRYYARTKWAWRLQEEIKNADKVPGNKAGHIANYMRDDFTNTILDTKGDFGILKGAIFLWVFGYSPVGAAINLSQVPLISYPFLASRFGPPGVGDVRASAALVKAMTNWKNFWTKGAYDNQTAFEMKAMEYGIKSGRISEAFSSQLAGAAQGGNLLGFGKSKAERGFQQILEKAPWLFEMAEQFNRRVTYMAALDLALNHPNSKGVNEAIVKYKDEFQQLQNSGFSYQQAAAIVAAVHSTEQTQFTYSRDTRPRFMQGRLAGTIFVFKTYLLNVLQLLGANKASVLPRFAITMMLAGGLMGLPGADELADLSEILGRWLFGKDFNARLALREFIKEIGSENIDPTTILHGLAAKGFGLPALVDLMGEHPGRGLIRQPAPSQAAYTNYLRGYRDRGGKSPMSFEEFAKQHSQNVPFPSFNLSPSISMGRILPLDLGKLTNPEGDPNAAIAASAQQASGAIFSVGFNLYKALANSQTPASDWKRWERAMPRALASASRGYRAFNEGRERGRGGPAGASTVVNYDVRDTEQMAEAIGMMLGFMPSRQSFQWDSIIAQQEVIKKFDVERELLLGQFFEARYGKDPQEFDRVRNAIVDWNYNLPDWARGKAITADSLQSSLTARALAKNAKESGTPKQLGNIPIARHVQGLFPSSVVDVRKISP